MIVKKNQKQIKKKEKKEEKGGGRGEGKEGRKGKAVARRDNRGLIGSNSLLGLSFP